MLTQVAYAQTNAERIAQEIIDRFSGDNALGERIDTERGRITAEAITIGQRDTAETTARTSADTALGTRVDTEASARAATDTTHTTDIATNTAAIGTAASTDADDNVVAATGLVGVTSTNADNISTNSDDIGADDTDADASGSNRQRINQEMAVRGDADTALGTRVDTEASARAVADTTHTTDIVANSDDIGADDTDADASGRNRQRINQEMAVRGDADTALGGRVDDEASARGNADTALGGRIDRNETRITNLGHRVNELEKDMSSGIAMSMALQAPSVSQDKKVNLSLGTGYFNGEIAAAFSFGARIDKSWSVNGGVGYGVGRKDVGARVGLSFEF